MNPILRKEMRSLLRERRGWLVPVVYAAALAAAVYLFYLSTSGGVSSRSIAEFSRVFAGLVAVMQIVAVIVFAPLIGSTSIAGEREHSTWIRLLASPIARSRIGLGKAVAASFYLLLLLSVSLPIATLSLLYGGADLATVGGIYVTHALLGVTLVCIGLAVSTYFQRTWTAALVAIGIALGLVVFSLAVTTAVGGFESYSPSWTRWSLYFNPGYSLFLFFVGDVEPASRIKWLAHYGALAVLAIGFLTIAMVRLRMMRE